MIDVLTRPWHWSIAGLLIGLTVPALLLLGNKKFGISSSLRHVCAACFPSQIPFFRYDWRKEQWNLFFVAGVMIGGFLAVNFLPNPDPIQIAPSTQQWLQQYGIKSDDALLPLQIFGWEQIFTLRGLVFFVLGGFLVGFGTRYAGGCTSGHTIMGISSLQMPSLIATIAFMVGGFLSANILLPFILTL